MYCEKCGSKNEMTSDFCTNCGNKLNKELSNTRVLYSNCRVNFIYLLEKG